MATDADECFGGAYRCDICRAWVCWWHGYLAHWISADGSHVHGVDTVPRDEGKWDDRRRCEPVSLS